MRLLLIEDNESLAAGLVLALHNKGFTINRVAGADAGLAALRGDPPDAVILDLGLPDMDGFDLLRRIRRENRELPVLILTARDAVRDKVAGLDLGADDYLAKPFEMEELEARLRVIVRRLGNASNSTIQVGDIVLDMATREVFRAGQAVELSRREYALLLRLMENAGKVLTRDNLETGLYAWGEEVASNAIEVHIHHLRKKLGANRIRTVRGVGYQLQKS